MSHYAEKTPEQVAAEEAADALNEDLSHYLLIICGAVSVAVITWKITDVATKYIRTIVGANSDNQRYFSRPSVHAARAKRHLLYAPVLSKRHNREIQISSALNVGTLPTRFQLLFLMAYFATNVAFCVIDIPYANDYAEVAGLIRNRAGVLSVVNMVSDPCPNPPEASVMLTVIFRCPCSFWLGGTIR